MPVLQARKPRLSQKIDPSHTVSNGWKSGFPGFSSNVLILIPPQCAVIDTALREHSEQLG